MRAFVLAVIVWDILMGKVQDLSILTNYLPVPPL